ncbi:amidohydrolase family protein [Sphingomonas sp. AP4-R1]|uniref:amidohydrolase family protein n=1 Tax=Sphingomonas sp. AP4-R1 TaxID=2735134 RepID=UPI001493DB7B|nr:amidohydrolase family protein [Sphingomonas sp. AP4-R1]QJU60692.1 amidohydrolase family protein [Sphingomonas sp. AP4-R1]
MSGVPAFGQSAKAGSSTLYSDVTLIDGSGKPGLPHRDILVRGERIVAIAPHGAIAEADRGDAARVDLAGRFVMPGLIDSHVHLATPPDAPKAQATLRRDLYGGVTAVRDMADDLRSVAELARASRTAEIPAPDIYFAAVMAGRPFFVDKRVAAVSQGYVPGTAPWAQAIDETTDLREAVALARGTGATAIKIYADLPPTLVKAITAEAHRQHVMVWAHSAIFPTRPADVIAAGPDVVSHICYLAYQLEPVMLASYEDHTPVHAALLKSGDDPVIAGLYREMLTRGTIIDATGNLFVRSDAERKAHPERRPLRCDGPETIRLTRQAWRAGVPISTGTDHGAGVSDPWPEVHDELVYLARDVGMPPLQVIRSATLVGAQAAGQAEDMGTVEAGKLANFVVLTRDPSADIANIRSIEMTVKRGRAYRRADYRPVTKAEMGDGDDD